MILVGNLVGHIVDSQLPMDSLTPDVDENGLSVSSGIRLRKALTIVFGATSLFLATVIGFGMGLGLWFSPKPLTLLTSLQPNPRIESPTSGSGNMAIASEDWQLDPSEYVLDMSWDATAPATTRYYDLIISEGIGWPDGVVREMLFINGKFPGPLIEMNRGDRLVVNVTNKLAASATTLHWHGIYQNGTNWYDGTHGITQCGIPPGQSFTYNFTVGNQYGTYWYHSHYSTQYLDGILGPLIIHAPEEIQWRQTYDDDRIVLVQDWYHHSSTINLANYIVPDNENTEPVPDNGLVNGKGYFNCSLYEPDSGPSCYDNNTYSLMKLREHSRSRLRLINTGAFAEFEFSIDNHTISVIEADGTMTEPHEVHRVPIHVGQRYSVVVHTNQKASTSYWIRAQMNTFCMAENEVLNPTTRAVLIYDQGALTENIRTPNDLSVDWSNAVAIVCKDLDDGDLIPAVAKRPPPATKFWRIDFSFGIGDYRLEFAKVNGTTWSALENTTTLLEAKKDSKYGNMSILDTDGVISGFGSSQYVVGIANQGVEVVDVLLYSLDEGAHPFHLHGHFFWILKTGSGRFDWNDYYSNIMVSSDTIVNSLRRDTLTVQGYSWSLVRFVADNPGLWAFHCHVAWHMQAGLMMQFLSRADVLSMMHVPDEVTELCAGW